MTSRSSTHLRPPGTAAAIAILCSLAPPALIAQDDEREPGWYDTAELTLVQTAGNTEASTFGFRNVLERVWESSNFTFTARALRADKTTFTRIARLGVTGGADVVELADNELTAESYLARLRYRHDVNEALFWFAGASWERNQFAGFDSRASAVGGLGNTWWDREESHFRTNYGATWTREETTFGGSDSFAGVELGWDYRRDFGKSSSYTSVLQIDENVDDTDDLRADFVNAVSVKMTERLALKVSLQLLFDNQPSLEEVPVLGPGDVPTGDVVLFELDELDSTLNVALVVDFG